MLKKFQSGINLFCPGKTVQALVLGCFLFGLSSLLNKANAQQSSLIDSLILKIAQVESKKEKVDLHNQIGYFADIDSVLVAKHSKTAISLAEEIDYNEGIADAYGNLAWTSLQLGDYTTSIIQWENTLKYAQESSYPRGEAKAYNGLGIVYETLGQFPQALDYNLKALKILEELEFTAGLASSYNNIGNIYTNLEDTENALIYFQKALAIDQDQGNETGMSYSFNNIGNVHKIEGNYEQALENLFKALELKQKAGSKRDQASTYNNIGATFFLLNDFDKAILYNEKSLALYREIDVKTRMAYPLIELGKAYEAKKQYRQALQYTQEGVAIAREIGEIQAEEAGIEALSRLFAVSKNYKAAYHNLVYKQQLSDSLQNDEITRKITRLATEYQFQKERDSIQFANQNSQLRLEQDIAKRKIIQRATFTGLLLFFALALVSYWFFRSKKRTNKILVEQKLNLELANEQIQDQKDEISIQNDQLKDLNHLKNRAFAIIAHDLKSPIASLQSLLMLFKSDSFESQEEMQLYFNKITTNVKGLSGLLNNLLFWAQSQMAGTKVYAPSDVAIKDVLEEALELFSEDISKKQLFTSINIAKDAQQVHVNPDILRFLLRNLLHNACKFSHPKGTLEVRTEVLPNEQVKFLVSDNGIGMTEEAQQALFHGLVKSQAGTNAEKGTGLGLNLCYEFVCNSQGEMGVNSILGKGSTFWFTLPGSSKS